MTCPTCALPLDEHERNIRFTLPDPVLELPNREVTEGVWMSHGTARESVMMQAADVGAFVRALLGVTLSGGYTVTYGVWVGIHPDDLRRTFEIWWEPRYVDLRLSGRLANRIEPWGMLGAPVELAVRDGEQTPWCESSTDPTLTSVLDDQWPHTTVLHTLPR